jgi:hypothetical protein
MTADFKFDALWGVKGSEFKALDRSEKCDLVELWWLDNYKNHTSASGAVACAAHFEAPVNTIRGLQRSAFEDKAAPWSDLFKAGAVELVEVEPELPSLGAELVEAQCELVERPVRATGHGPGKRGAYEVRDGVFYAIGEGPLCACPKCGAQAFTHGDMVGGFGVRMIAGQPRPQSYCRACKSKASSDAQKRKRAQIVLPIGAAT